MDTSADGGEIEPNRRGELNVLVVEVESSDSERLRLSCMMMGGGWWLIENAIVD